MFSNWVLLFWVDFSAYNQNPRPFSSGYQREDPHPHHHEEPLYRAQVVSLPTQSSPAPAPIVPGQKKKRVIPFAFKNQLPRPADDVVPEIVEERINPVQQQIAERELYAHQARNRAIKTTKSFVNQCVNQGAGRPVAVSTLTSSGPKEVNLSQQGAYDDTGYLNLYNYLIQ